MILVLVLGFFLTIKDRLKKFHVFFMFYRVEETATLACLEKLTVNPIFKYRT